MNSSLITNLLTPTANDHAANKGYVDTSIPIGGIIMWSGTTGTSLPSNWKLCDGSTYNSIVTPDLRGRFVLSSTSPTSANGGIPLAGGLSTRNVNATGGAETVTLTEAQMPQHKHDVSARTGGVSGTTMDGGHTHSVSASGNVSINKYDSQTLFYTGQAISILTQYAYNGTIPAGSVTVTGTAADSEGTKHNHTITVSETNKGSGNPHENMPPFYVLAFIMRIS